MDNHIASTAIYGDPSLSKPLAGLGQAFIDAALQYDTNPAVLVAIGFQESHWGYDQRNKGTNNAFGLLHADGSKLTFDSWQEGIFVATKSVDSAYNRGNRSVSDLYSGLDGGYCAHPGCSDAIKSLEKRVRALGEDPNYLGFDCEMKDEGRCPREKAMRNTFCCVLTKVLVLGVALLWTAICPASADCVSWTDSRYGYSVCLPIGWYKRTMPSGALFLCDKRRGPCTIPVGGGPMPDHALISLVPAEVALTDPPLTLEEFAHRVADKDPSSQFSKIASVSGKLASINYIVVTQTSASGGRNEVPQVVNLYFAQADRVMIELILEFNSGDQQSQMYREMALKIVVSLRPKG